MVYRECGAGWSRIRSPGKLKNDTGDSGRRATLPSSQGCSSGAVLLFCGHSQFDEGHKNDRKPTRDRMRHIRLLGTQSSSNPHHVGHRHLRETVTPNEHTNCADSDPNVSPTISSTTLGRVRIFLCGLQGFAPKLSDQKPDRIRIC